MFMLYLDLAELPGVFRGQPVVFRARRAPARFCREDHLGIPEVPLDEACATWSRRKPAPAAGARSAC
jgi:uncharacterized protein